MRHRKDAVIRMLYNCKSGTPHTVVQQFSYHMANKI